MKHAWRCVGANTNITAPCQPRREEGAAVIMVSSELPEILGSANESRHACGGWLEDFARRPSEENLWQRRSDECRGEGGIGTEQ